MIFLGPKLVGEVQIWLGTWCRRRGFVGFRICGIPANFLDFAGFQQDIAGITVEDIWEKNLLLRAFWKKVLALREIKTLGGGGGVHCEI
jgi:hypothetical protein